MGEEIVNGKEFCRKFKALFIEPGLVKFKIKGREITSLLTAETIQNALGTMIGKSLRLGHDDKTSHGSSASVFREDNWYGCEGTTETQAGIDAIKKGDRVSCAYRVNSTAPARGRTWHNIPFDEEITAIEFTHLAVVDKDDARYEDAVIVLNSKSSDTTMSKATKWIMKKLGIDGQPVETSGEIPADDTRLNSLIEKYRAKQAAVPAEAFIEIDGKQVPMSELNALDEVTNTKDDAAAKAEADAKAKAEEDERTNARQQGYSDFIKVATARTRGNSEPVDTIEALSPDTMDIRIARGLELFGGKPASGRN